MKNKLFIGSGIALGLTFMSFATFVTVSHAQDIDSENLFGRVANILGIDQDKLEDAFETAAVDGINERVSDGTISQERADKMIERINEDGFRFEQKGPRGGHAIEQISEILGLTPEEIKTQIDEGKTLEQVITDAGKSVDEVKIAMITEIKSHMSERLAEGEITQEELDERVAHLEERIDNILSGARPQMMERRGDFNK